MLQYKTQPTDRYSVPEQCQMVIEGGCAWIQLHLPDATDADIRELCSELIPLCRETSTILMLENRPELAKDLGLHGVHITADSGLNARQVREDFGPEAIIGIEVADPASIVGLQGADIDYVTLHMTPEKGAEVICHAAQGGNTMPVVLAGDFTVGDISRVIAAGASGILTGADIIGADNPVERTEQLLNALTSR